MIYHINKEGCIWNYFEGFSQSKFDEVEKVGFYFFVLLYLL